jgi:pantoate--beta-alanine ligase
MGLNQFKELAKVRYFSSASTQISNVNSMIIIRKSAELQENLQNFHRENNRIGFVPTMGALHNGHLSLINTSKQEVDITVCSIFVNPAQFNDPKDYEKYPNTIEKDLQFLESVGTDLVFLPTVDDIYPGGTRKLEHYDLGELETILEGQYRPGHFQGVCQVMSRLLQAVQPNELYMGQKDYQQCMVIARLLLILKMGSKTQLHICPTVREQNGLAMSSRNLRLTDQEKKKAVALSEVLQFVKNEIRVGNLTPLELEAASFLSSRGFKVDYFEIANADSLELLHEWDGKTKLVALTAAFLNQVRLIDNMLLN